MEVHPKIFIGTVCLERNRWSTKQPSYRVSDWLPRFKADGFDGVELWENHFALADAEEQRRLSEAGVIAVYNTYAGFADEDAEARERAAEAIARLAAPAAKYNVGKHSERLAEYRRNLLAWAERLPADCRLLCECHPGTALEQPPAAAEFFAGLDPARFGIIVHITGKDDRPELWFEALPSRVHHLHVQLRDAAADPAVPAHRERLAAIFDGIRARGFNGTATIEFTRGIGPREDLETLYANARTDLAWCRERLG